MARDPLTYPGVKRPSRWRDVRRRYGITRNEFEALLKNQEGLCGICLSLVERLTVDHCHASGLVRGLLCDACNRGIGYLREDPRILYAASAYVIRHSGLRINHEKTQED